MNAPKFFADSKTIFFALLVAIAGLGDVIAPYTPQLQELLGQHWFTWLMLAISFATAVLRQCTAGGLSLSKPPASIPPTNGDPPMLNKLMLFVPLVALTLLVGCTGLTKPSPGQPSPPPLTETQKVEAACAAADAGIESLTAANKAGFLSAKQQNLAQPFIDYINTTCSGTTPPTLAQIESDAFSRAVAALASVLLGGTPTP